MSSNPSSTSQNENKEYEGDEAVLEKIDFYANKVNVFFAMQPAIETLEHLAQQRKEVTKQIIQGTLNE